MAEEVPVFIFSHENSVTFSLLPDMFEAFFMIKTNRGDNLCTLWVCMGPGSQKHLDIIHGLAGGML